ncbi:MAG: DUF559 domain-containing protein [Roseiarcus sp.]
MVAHGRPLLYGRWFASLSARRARGLEAAGWRVLRFSNAQVMRRIDEVLDAILAAIEGRR